MTVENKNQTKANWIVRLIALLIFLAACSTHFPAQTGDVYIPQIRSAKRNPFPPQFAERELAEIENEVRELWSQLESKMSEGERDLFSSPATEAEIESLEDLIGARLPPDFRAYLKIHNGTKGFRSCLYQRPLSIKDMKKELLSMRGFIEFGLTLDATENTVQYQNLWRPGLVLFAEDDGAGKAVDCATGKVIYWDHDGWYFSVENENFTELLKTAVKDSLPGHLNW